MFTSTGFDEAWAGWDVDRRRALVRRMFRKIELSTGRGTERIAAYPNLPHNEDAPPPIELR